MQKNTLFVCPICGSKLNFKGQSYLCQNNHCFDIAKEGYVNLLAVNLKKSLSPGDDKGMSAARNVFLSAGYYEPLLSRLNQICDEFSNEKLNMLDCGCGEGYYTSGIYSYLADKGKKVNAAGIDISKPILKKAAKRDGNIDFAVASSFHLPVKDGSIDLLINCFSPIALEEFDRVLNQSGVFVYAVPAKRHLWQLKEILYENPYENDETLIPHGGFKHIRTERIDNTIDINNKAHIDALFHMTPYFWKTPESGIKNLEKLDKLKVETSFDIHIFKKG